MTPQTITPPGQIAALVDDIDLIAPLAAELTDEIERYLAARRRTAHPLVTETTEELIRQALAELGTRPASDPAPTGPHLPGGLWRILPDRLLSLHPGRRGVAVQRMRISTAEHLELTALLLERWGWSKTPGHWRTPGGRRCILGAQAALFHLGYGTEDTAAAAGAHLNGVLRSRGIATAFPQWNDSPHVSRDQVLALVRDAATAARR